MKYEFIDDYLYIDGEKIEGSLDVKNYYVGTSEPASSLGNNGDIYLKR